MSLLNKSKLTKKYKTPKMWLVFKVRSKNLVTKCELDKGQYDPEKHLYAVKVWANTKELALKTYKGK